MNDAARSDTDRLDPLVALLTDCLNVSDLGEFRELLVRHLACALAFERCTLVLGDGEPPVCWTLQAGDAALLQAQWGALPADEQLALRAVVDPTSRLVQVAPATVVVSLHNGSQSHGALALRFADAHGVQAGLARLQHLAGAFGTLLSRLTTTEAEHQQRRLEARYRLLVESVTDYAIYMLDPDGFVVSWNPGAQRLKGYAEAEVLGRHVSLFYRPEDVQAGAPLHALRTAVAQGRFETEAWRRAKGGRDFWAHVVIDPIRAPTGELLGYAKVTRDLSERKAAEESLRRSEQQFMLLVQGVTDYAIYMLDPGGLITSWNLGAQRIKGYAPQEAVGTHFSRFYRPEDQARGDPHRTLTTAGREGRFESEGWRVRKDGSQFWAHVVVDAIRDDRGQIIGFAKVTRDVTEKREAMLALDRARESLFQAQKLDAIGQLTGGVAHDFNNLLMVILSSLYMAQRRLPDDDKLGLLIDNAIKGAKRGAALTQRMLAFARRQDLDPEVVQLPLLVKGMSDMLNSTLGAVRVETDFPPDLSPVLIDANQLELAILNLCVNARDAMPQGGVVRISAHDEVVTADHAKLPPGRYVCISVSDEGMGMDAQTLDKALEPFFTTKGVGKGTGLGLPMVHGLAAQSGGQFLIYSTPGVGTRAEVWLPVATAAVAGGLGVTSSIAPAEPGPPLPRSLQLLVVDDDHLVLSGTSAMLEEMGHRVTTASSGDEALALMQQGLQVSMVITDQVMPGLTGVQLIEKLRADRPGLRFLLATGYGELPEMLRADVGRLSKPFDEAQLAAAIHQLLESWTPA